MSQTREILWQKVNDLQAQAQDLFLIEKQENQKGEEEEKDINQLLNEIYTEITQIFEENPSLNVPKNSEVFSLKKLPYGFFCDNCKVSHSNEVVADFCYGEFVPIDQEKAYDDRYFYTYKNYAWEKRPLELEDKIKLFLQNILKVA